MVLKAQIQIIRQKQKGNNSWNSTKLCAGAFIWSTRHTVILHWTWELKAPPLTVSSYRVHRHWPPPPPCNYSPLKTRLTYWYGYFAAPSFVWLPTSLDAFALHNPVMKLEILLLHTPTRGGPKNYLSLFLGFCSNTRAGS